MGYAFISYSSKNQESADALRHLLGKNNIETWMAPYDIPAGSQYAGVISKALKECACVVLLLTEASQNSQWVAKEIERAINYQKTIVPIQMGSLVLNDEFEFYISSNHIVAVREIDEKSPELKKAVETVKFCAGVTSGGKAESDAGTTGASKKSDDISSAPGTTHGELQFDNGKYVGEIRDGKMNGKGVFYYNSGSRYEGDYVNDQRTGKGVYYGNDGTRYEGDFVDGVMNGKGVYYFSSGNRYEGDFVDGKFHGKGVIYYNNGNRYEGDFVDDKRTGKGVYYFSSGARYEGDFADDKRTGKGVFYNSNGDRYEGDYVDGKRSGEGIFYYADGRKEKRYYNNGELTRSEPIY